MCPNEGTRKWSKVEKASKWSRFRMKGECERGEGESEREGEWL